jgi:hypothetical protein
MLREYARARACQEKTDFNGELRIMTNVEFRMYDVGLGLM